ncbi:hypothetical protein PENTCL1PPCAC_25483, partial [Pristionchus entomophagus]
MHVAFLVTLIVIVAVAVVLAVVLSTVNQPEKGPSVTVSLYVGDVDENQNARRKRDTGDPCMHLEDVKKTVSETLSKLATEGNVQSVRFLTYSDTSEVSESMPLDVGQSQLSKYTIIRNGKAPKQTSSLQLFNNLKQPKEDLVHYMPCSTSYDGYADDAKAAGVQLKNINGDS